MKRYLVIGAGVSGCSAALELAQTGHRVTMLESTGRPGGSALSYACKATESCSRCGVCVAYSRIAEALLHPGVTLLEGASVEKAAETPRGRTVRGWVSNPRIRRRECTGCGACVTACPAGALSLSSRAGLELVAVDYSACLLHKGESCTACADACPQDAVTTGPARQAFSIRADAVLLATGHENFDPSVKPRLGYSRVPGVMTGLEAEKILSRQTWLPAAAGASGTRARSIAFIQCVGSRDPSLNRGFCSAVCCAASLRMARLLASRNPETRITIYFIDIQNFDKVFTPFRAELEGMGIRFVRGTPFSVTRTAAGTLSLRIEDPRGGQAVAEHDAVVLAAGISPSGSAARLAGLFGLERDEFGFLRGRPGVLTAGTCAEPQGILDSVASARAAALEMVT